MKEYKKELEVAKNIARQAGLIMLEYFDSDQQIERKEDNTVVTIADKKINRLVIEEISKYFDDIVIGEEESSGEYGNGRCWFCDPIDGTKAFVWGVPTAMFSLALILDGQPVLGVAYDPFLDLLYEAVINQGSYCNGKPLNVSKKELDGGTIAFASSPKKAIEKADCLKVLIKKGAELGMFSGAVYKSCLVAKGKFVGYFEWDVNAHDVAAVHVIVEEAGGKITGIDGKKLDYNKPFKGAIVSNGIVHEDILECIN